MVADEDATGVVNEYLVRDSAIVRDFVSALRNRPDLRVHMSAGEVAGGPLRLTNEYVEWLDRDESFSSLRHGANGGSLVLRVAHHRNQRSRDKDTLKE